MVVDDGGKGKERLMADWKKDDRRITLLTESLFHW